MTHSPPADPLRLTGSSGSGLPAPLPSPYGWDFVTPGLPDAAFEDAPGFSPTPMELRVMLLAHLRPRADSLVWDVGGGHRCPCSGDRKADARRSGPHP